jgi:hypothetical protein
MGNEILLNVFLRLFCTRHIEKLKERAFPLMGSLLHMQFTQLHFTLEPLELQVFTGLTTLRRCLDESHVRH